MDPNPSNRWSLQLLALSLAAGMIPFFTAPAVANQGDTSPDTPGANDEPEASAPRKATEGGATKTLDKVSASVSTKPVTAAKPQAKPAMPDAPKPAPVPNPAGHTPGGTGDSSTPSTPKPQSNPTNPKPSQSPSSPGERGHQPTSQSGQPAASTTTLETVDIFAPDGPTPSGGSSHHQPENPKPFQPSHSDQQPTDQGRLVPLVPDLWGTPPPSQLPPRPAPHDQTSPDAAQTQPSDDHAPATPPNQTNQPSPAHPSASPTEWDGTHRPDQSEGGHRPNQPDKPSVPALDNPDRPAGSPGSTKPARPHKPQSANKPSDSEPQDSPADAEASLPPGGGANDDRADLPDRLEPRGDSGDHSQGETAPSKPNQPAIPEVDERPMQSLTGTPNPPKPAYPPTPPAPAHPSGSPASGGPSGSSHHTVSPSPTGSGATSSNGSSSSTATVVRPSKPQASPMITAVLPAPVIPTPSTPIMAQPSEPAPTPPVSPPESMPTETSVGEAFSVRHPALLAVTMSHPNSGDGAAKATIGGASYTPTPIAPANAGAVDHGHAQLVKSRQQPVSSSRITQWLDAVQEDLHRRASGQQPAHTVWAAEAGDKPELGSTWTIRPGDTAWSLARAIWGEDVSWSVMESTWITLVAWNPELANAVPHHLPEGVTIIIPADIPTPTDI